MSIPVNSSRPSAPTLLQRDGRAVLSVDGEPYVILGAELHNSSTGTISSIRTAFDAIAGRNVNTVLAAITWETVEPTEGEFDLSLLDELLHSARSAATRLVLLWFGAWKNGRSSYTPGWVKTDPARFPRAEIAEGVPIEHLSPFGLTVREYDGRAFGAVMAHLRVADPEFTVIMAQVENETGLLGAPRDLSAAARAAYESPVDDRVFRVLEQDSRLRLARVWRDRGGVRVGGWNDVFGDSDVADEAFMAVAYASHIETVTRAGKSAHSIPMFTNAWLDSEIDVPGFALAGGQRPGTYPSGGPLPHVAGLWHEFAPSLDFLAPDIYFGDFNAICEAFAEASSGLFIPEMRRDEVGAADLFLALGSHNALGVSPFGVDSLDVGDGLELRDSYGMVSAIAPSLSEHPSLGFHLHAEHPTATMEFGDYVLTAHLQAAFGTTSTVSHGYGLVIWLGDDRFVSVGRGFELTPARGDGRPAGILRAEELGQLRGSDGPATRRLNGDETHSGDVIVHPALRPPDAGPFPIPPSRPGTGVVRFELYGL